MSQFFARFLYPIRVSAGENVMIVNGVSCTVPPGTYYQRVATGGETARFPSFYAAVVSAATTASVTLLATAPWTAPSGYRYRETLGFISTVSAFSFDFDNVAWTLPPEYLGFPPDIDVQVDSVLDGSVNSIVGTRSALGSWIAGTVNGGDWTDITSHIEKEIYASTDPIYEHTKIIRMRDDRVPRIFDFDTVPGVRVQGGEVRGSDVAYRETADLGTISDAFSSDGDAVSLRSMYARVNGGQEWIVQYGDEDEIALVAGKWEGLRLATASQHSSFEEWYTLTIPGGEFYDVSFLGLVVAGGYDF